MNDQYSAGGRLRLAIRASLLVVAALSLGACNCGLLSPNKGKSATPRFALASRAAPGSANKKKKAPKDHYLVAIAPKKDTGFVFTRPPARLYPPYVVTAKFGIYDADKSGADQAGIFGIEVDAEGTAALPESFYGIFAQFASGGLSVFVSSHDGNAGDEFFAGTLVVEVRMEQTGTALTFSARPEGSTAPFTVIATVTVPEGDLPLNPGLGMFDRSDGAEVGFDEFRVVSNGTPPTPPPAADAAVFALYDVAQAMSEVMYAVDGAAPDDTAALARVADLESALDAATTAVGQLDGANKAKSDAQKALSQLKKVDKKVASIRKLLRKKGAASKGASVIKTLSKFAKKLVVAGDLIISDDLRSTLPRNEP